MPHSVSAILDGKSRAMVQTAQTQCALRLDPHRLAVAHLYRRRRASVGTKSATGTTVCHKMEMPRLPLAPVGGMINTSNHMRYSHSLCVSAPAGHNSAYRCVYLLFGRRLATAALPLVGQIEQRSPRVHHTHRQTGIDSHTFIQQRFASHPTSLSGRRTVGGDGIDKATPRIRKCQRFEKLRHNRRQAPALETQSPHDAPSRRRNQNGGVPHIPQSKTPRRLSQRLCGAPHTRCCQFLRNRISLIYAYFFANIRIKT